MYPKATLNHGFKYLLCIQFWINNIMASPHILATISWDKETYIFIVYVSLDKETYIFIVYVTLASAKQGILTCVLIAMYPFTEDQLREEGLRCNLRAWPRPHGMPGARGVRLHLCWIRPVAPGRMFHLFPLVGVSLLRPGEFKPYSIIFSWHTKNCTYMNIHFI